MVLSDVEGVICHDYANHVDGVSCVKCSSCFEACSSAPRSRKRQSTAVVVRYDSFWDCLRLSARHNEEACLQKVRLIGTLKHYFRVL